MRFPDKYLPFLRREIRSYMDKRLMAYPNTVFIAAVLEPRGGAMDGEGGNDAEGQGEGDPRLDPTPRGPPSLPDDGGSGRGAAGEGEDGGDTGPSPSMPPSLPPSGLVGICEICARDGPRTRYLSLNPPKSCAYLSNLAVSPAMRRRGVATQLVRASERMALLQNEHKVYLHTRLKDAPATELYKGLEYRIEKTDLWYMSLLGLDRRFLMTKVLPPAPPPPSGL
jgi:ribosomal protein S18 acetylase RimI-like enzyme